jgi:septal ring factor EnvC (AmiA/AmiB activator)
MGILALLPTEPRAADVKEELRGIKREISEKKSLLKKTRNVEIKVSGELEQIEKNLHEKEASLNILGRDLAGVESVLDRTYRDIEIVKGEAERKREQINRRLAAIYKAGEVGSARMFFASDSLPQMAENLRYMRAILDNDRRLFEEYNKKIDQLRILKTSLEREAARKEKIKKAIEAKKQEVEEEKKKKAAYLLKVRDDKKTYQGSLKELEANARRLQDMMERLEAESRKSYTKQRGKSVIDGGKVLPPAPDTGFGSQKGRLSLPVKGEVAAGFGRHKHPEFNSYTVSNGVSIVARQGSDIHSVYDGQVIFAGYFKGYGNMIIVDHGGGFFSLYAHAAKLFKKVGASVVRNEVVADVGDVDSAAGPMLYFEIRYQGKPVDPGPWFR